MRPPPIYRGHYYRQYGSDIPWNTVLAITIVGGFLVYALIS